MVYDLKVTWRLLALPWQPVLMTFYWRVSGTGAQNVFQAAAELWEKLQYTEDWFIRLANNLPIFSHFTSVTFSVRNGGAVQSYILDGTNYHGTNLDLFIPAVPLSVQARILWVTASRKKPGYSQIPFMASTDVINQQLSSLSYIPLNLFAIQHATHLVGSLGDDLIPSVPRVGGGFEPIIKGVAMRTLSRQLHRRDRV